MPIYEYSCERCGKGFEHLAQSFDAPAPPCPSCGAKKARRQLSVFAAGSAKTIAAGCRSCPAGDAGCPQATRGHGPGCGCCAH
ncbi:MAG: zinc ribbon domain-containing protein [Kiritimatiellae bacterium]|nr:zinc ribbon domain-containing protein [Kiritimatiellia bacterium]